MGSGMKVFSKEGMEMMDVKSIERDGDSLVIKGKIMGAMSAVMVIGPADVWQATKLLGWGTIARLPLILVKGMFGPRKTARA